MINKYLKGTTIEKAGGSGMLSLSLSLSFFIFALN
jgi:hypothetical protein